MHEISPENAIRLGSLDLLAETRESRARGSARQLLDAIALQTGFIPAR